MPLISIILPVYNSKKERLTQSIESVFSQSFKDFELIIINDASTNDIEATILEYITKDKRIVYIKNKENLKLTKTLNKGLEISQGQYIARIDDDDIWMDKEKIQKQIDFMNKNPKYGLCGTNVYLGKIDGTIQSKLYMVENDIDIRRRMLLSTQFSHSSIMVRKSAIDMCGIYNPDYNLMEDHELWLRIGQKFKLHNIQDFTTFYRYNPQGVSLKNRRQQQRLALQLCWKYRKDYPSFVKGLFGSIILNILPAKVIGRINRINRLFDKPFI